MSFSMNPENVCVVAGCIIIRGLPCSTMDTNPTCQKNFEYVFFAR